MSEQKSGCDLRVGDSLVVNGRRDRIVSLTPYVGSLAYLWNHRAMIATLTLCNSRITIEPDATYEN